MIIKEQDHQDLFMCLICIVLNIPSSKSRASWRQVTVGRGVAVPRSEPAEGTRGKEMTPEQPGTRQRQHFQCHFSLQSNDDGLGDLEKEKDNSTSDGIEGLTKTPRGEK